MSEQNYSIDQDLKEAEAMAEALVPYVYEKELYRPVGGSMPTLTLGALLMRVRRLSALQANMNDKQRALFAKIAARHEEIRHEWKNAYDAKEVSEALSRLEAMKPYLDECGSAYMPEALRRTIVEEIRLDMRAHNIDSAEVDSKARSMDSKLRGCLEPSSFIWATMLQEIYPADSFWWLYQRASKR